MNYLISDEHYFHTKILGYTNRNFEDIGTMKYELMKRHNEIVTDKDTTYHLGDFAFTENWKEVASILKRLKGNHVLILGNHDFIYVPHYVEAGFQSVHTSLQLDGFTLIHDPAVAGVLTDGKYIHGHLHQMGLRIAPNCYNVSVEMHDYYPVSLEQIKFEWNQQ
jgi:calcineurin-like phosphoesterase family protein